jgi:hypothetical protein
MLMRMKLDVVLDAVAEADDNTLRAFMIITWAERTGNVRRLIDGAGRADARQRRREETQGTPAAGGCWIRTVSLTPAPDAIPVVPASADAEAQATHDYLSFLYTRYKHLDFKGMGMADRVPLQLPVADMYVPLKARIELPEGETWSHELRLAGRKMTKAEAENIGKRFSGPQPVLDLLKRYMPGLSFWATLARARRPFSNISPCCWRSTGAQKWGSIAACRCWCPSPPTPRHWRSRTCRCKPSWATTTAAAASTCPLTG